MPEPILCKICGKRRARRTCPAVEGDICPICCGTEREVSLSCPLECEYLQEAHRHEKPIAIPPEQIAYASIEVTESFIRRQEELVLFCVYALLQAAQRTAGTIDADVMAALEAMIQTHRTAESGLIYESRPENFVALGVQRSFTASLEDYQKMKAEREPLSPIRSSDVLRTLVFLHRLGQQNQNGRPRGRMFLDLLRQMTPETPVESAPAPSIII
jgi:hypothetical protein